MGRHGSLTEVPAAPSARECGCPESRTADLTRRSLFRFAGASGLVAATTVGSARVAFGAPGAGAHTLVVLSLRGGFDGMSAVAPIGDPHYAAQRPNIAIPAGAAMAAGSVFGLHPALAPLYPLWKAGTFGAIHAVGQAAPTRSHFAAMDEMERAAPGSTVRTGWIDRTLGVVGGDSSFTVSQVGSPSTPRSFAGPAPEFAMRSIGDVKLSISEDTVPLSAWRQAVGKLHAGARPEVTAPITTAFAAVGQMRQIQARDGTTTDADEKAARTALGYPEGNLGSALHDVARLVKADVGLQVATVDYGDWDMHVGLGGTDANGWMTRHLGDLATAMAAFAKELGPDLSRVTLLTLSEFGRRLEENGSGGLDHGHGNAVLALGGSIKGGQVHGRWPGLAPEALVDGDLDGTTDYRDIVAEVLTSRLGVGSTSQVFPGLKAKPVGLVR